jgi:hypothetical protein
LNWRHGVRRVPHFAAQFPDEMSKVRRGVLSSAPALASMHRSPAPFGLTQAELTGDLRWLHACAEGGAPRCGLPSLGRARRRGRAPRPADAVSAGGAQERQAATLEYISHDKSLRCDEGPRILEGRASFPERLRQRKALYVNLPWDEPGGGGVRVRNQPDLPQRRREAHSPSVWMSFARAKCIATSVAPSA